MRFPVFPHLPCRPARPEQLSLLWLHSSSGLSPKCLARHFSVRAPLLRIFYRSAHQFRRNPHNPKAPTPWVKDPRSGFLTRFAVYSSFGLAGLFHPANALRLSLQGFPLPRSCINSSPMLCRHVVFPWLRSRLLVDGTNGAPAIHS